MGFLLQTSPVFWEPPDWKGREAQTNSVGRGIWDGWCLGVTDVNWRDWRAIGWGSRSRYPGRGNSKAGSRSVKGCKQKGLIKYRAEVTGRERGELKGFISQAQAELPATQHLLCLPGQGVRPGEDLRASPAKDTESLFYLKERIKQNRSVGWELGGQSGVVTSLGSLPASAVMGDLSKGEAESRVGGPARERPVGVGVGRARWHARRERRRAVRMVPGDLGGGRGQTAACWLGTAHRAAWTGRWGHQGSSQEGKEQAGGDSVVLSLHNSWHLALQPWEMTWMKP